MPTHDGVVELFLHRKCIENCKQSSREALRQTQYEENKTTKDVFFPICRHFFLLDNLNQ